MDEQWNRALDQVADEFLIETLRYRRKRRWPGVVAAAAAVLMLAVGWWSLKPRTVPDPTLSGSTEPPNLADPTEGLLDGSMGGCGNVPAGTDRGETNEVIDQEPPMTETLHFDTYEDLQTACQEQKNRYLHPDVMIPYCEGQPVQIQDITVFEKEMYDQPWVWYFLSHTPHITIRIPTSSTLTAHLDPDTSGAEALRLIWPEAPNVHNWDDHKDAYSEIREVTITTLDGEKQALLRQEADRDRAYLTFLQNGTLVTVAGPVNELQGDWLNTFSLVPIGDFRQEAATQRYRLTLSPSAATTYLVNE